MAAARRREPIRRRPRPPLLRGSSWSGWTAASALPRTSPSGQASGCGSRGTASSLDSPGRSVRGQRRDKARHPAFHRGGPDGAASAPLKMGGASRATRSGGRRREGGDGGGGRPGRWSREPGRGWVPAQGAASASRSGGPAGWRAPTAWLCVRIVPLVGERPTEADSLRSATAAGDARGSPTVTGSPSPRLPVPVPLRRSGTSPGVPFLGLSGEGDRRRQIPHPARLRRAAPASTSERVSAWPSVPVSLPIPASGSEPPSWWRRERPRHGERWEGA